MFERRFGTYDQFIRQGYPKLPRHLITILKLHSA